jgi:hypothetical protein
MASVKAPTAAPFYGAVNPALLGDFGDEDDEPLVSNTFNVPVRPANTQQQQQQQAPPTTQPRPNATINRNPLEAVQDAIRNFILPELNTIRREQGRLQTTLPQAQSSTPGYKLRVNPSLLDLGFEDEDPEPPRPAAQGSRATTSTTTATPPPTQQGTTNNTQRQGGAYNDPSNDLLNIWDDDATVNTTPVTVAKVTTQTTAASTSAAAESLSSNNPYAALIEQKQKAMTVAFLTTPEVPIAELEGSTPVINPDDLAYVFHPLFFFG